MIEILGLDVTSREDAPEAWVLAQGGDPSNEDHYLFISDGVFHEDPTTGQMYHAGRNIFGLPVAEVIIDQETVVGIAFEEIPEAAKQKLLGE